MNKSNRRLSILLIAAIGISSFSSAQELEPILKELEENGIIFNHKNVPYLGYNPESIMG
mgnify:CR=1 FL=1